MSKRVLIETQGNKREIALMEDQKLLCCLKDQETPLEAEQIYLGKVDRMIRGMEAAFVQLGNGLTGFLPYAECRQKPRSGDRLLLQVKKPPVGDKAPYMTADLSLAGRYALLTPLSCRHAVSKKITEEADRARLLALAARLAPSGMGLVLRTESLNAAEEAVAQDVDALLQTWTQILLDAERAPEPGLIRGREDALLRLLRDEHGLIDEICTDAPETVPETGIPVRAGEQHPFTLYNVRPKLEKALQRKIWLDCGGYLIWDRTEALTVIDVNSGKYLGEKAGTERSFLRLNLEAAREIARLLRLRCVGGIIIVDFVDMRDDEHRAAVQSEMERALLQDPVKAVVHGFTHLGLMEITRKKSGTELTARTIEETECL